MLIIENLTKTFNEKIILNNINLWVEKGNIAVLLGKSGVGKSTLLRILNNLELPDSGNIYLNNKKLEPNTINKTHVIGMVFQLFNLFEHLTVEQNITLALEKVLKKNKHKAKKIAYELLEHYDLYGKANKFVSQLSGGQKQRLSIARALALKPQILCLDEPTSSLDPLLTTHVANNIQQLSHEGYTVLVATHDTALLDKLHCIIYLMERGKIVESATSGDFFKNKNAYPMIEKFVSGKI